MKPCLFIFLLGFASLLRGQVPSHFVLGQDFLAGIDVYGLEQDEGGYYYLATANGLYVYDGYRFEVMPCEALRSASLLGLKKDRRGRLHCHNLNGQIFEMDRGICRLLTTLPDEFLSDFLFFDFTASNDLVVASRDLLHWDRDKDTWVVLHKTSVNYNPFKGIHRLANGGLILSLIDNQGILELDAGAKEVRVSAYWGEVLGQGSFYHFFEGLSAQVWAMNHDDGTCYDYPTGKFKGLRIDLGGEHKRGNALHLYQTRARDLLFVARQGGGVSFFDGSGRGLYGGQLLFKDYIISAFLEDVDGGLIFGTLGGGLLWIPSLEVSTWEALPLGEQASNLVWAGARGLVVSSKQGHLWAWEGDKAKWSSLGASANKGINCLLYDAASSSIIFEGAEVGRYDIESGKAELLTDKLIGSLKSGLSLDKQTILLGTHSDLYAYSPNGKAPEADFGPWFSYSKQIWRNSQPLGRIRALAYDDLRKGIYVGTTSGLFWGAGGQWRELEAGGGTISASACLFHETYAYVATEGQGLYVFEGDKLVGHFKTGTKGGLLISHIHQMISWGSYLILAGHNGLQIFDPKKGENRRFLTQAEGLYSNNILRMVKSGEALWLLHQKGIQYLSLDSLPSLEPSLSLKLAQVLVNERPLDPSSGDLVFGYQENYFRFVLSAPSLRYASVLRFRYRLLGLDETWQEQSYQQQQVDYRSLPSGDYVFEAQVLALNKESAVLRYGFSIAPPFWTRWWFILGLALFFILVGMLIYRRQSQVQLIQERQLRALNQAKLKALQAQMNPHFLFNALNSIQDLVLQGDIDNSYDYIVRFSQLVRATLQHSNRDYISLGEEIEQLNRYLAIEKLRFGADFSYHIEASAELKAVLHWEIPPMLIQPFLENALVHGLFHRQGSKYLNISWLFNAETKVLHCRIEDNGIGREAARQIMERQHNQQHKSFALEALRTRLEILQEEHPKTHLGFGFEDLCDAQGRGLGTVVHLRLPLRPTGFEAEEDED